MTTETSLRHNCLCGKPATHERLETVRDFEAETRRATGTKHYKHTGFFKAWCDDCPEPQEWRAQEAP